jgi:hypothetical protein
VLANPTDFVVHCGDALEVLKTLPSESVNCCITSPPYYGLRDYGVDGQIGLDERPEQYVEQLVTVFREMRRVLRDDGTFWLNIGDSYAGSWGNYGGQNRGSGKQRDITTGSQAHQSAYDGLERWRPPTSQKLEGLKPKDLIGIPWMLAFALRADGWYLRSEIIWHKSNPMPESVKDRPTKAHEQIFLLSKSPKYCYNYEAIKEPFVTDPRENYPRRAHVTGRGAQPSSGAPVGNPQQDRSGGFPLCQWPQQPTCDRGSSSVLRCSSGIPDFSRVTSRIVRPVMGDLPPSSSKVGGVRSWLSPVACPWRGGVPPGCRFPRSRSILQHTGAGPAPATPVTSLPQPPPERKAPWKPRGDPLPPLPRRTGTRGWFPWQSSGRWCQPGRT